MAGNIKSVCYKHRICQKRVGTVSMCVFVYAFFQRHAFYLFPNVMQRFVTESYQPDIFPVFFHFLLAAATNQIYFYDIFQLIRVYAVCIFSFYRTSLNDAVFFSFQKLKKAVFNHGFSSMK